MPAVFVADPFMVRNGSIWYMFFEVMNWKTGKGEIGLATSDDTSRWTYQQIVLTEPFHLSYPYVFAWLGDYYMIPESYQSGSVRLYKALDFPTRWAFVTTLLSGAYLVDASAFRHANRWWLFVETSPRQTHDTLRLYSADDLVGPWVEHPKSPVIQDDMRAARPAGRVLVGNRTIVRYAQNCYPSYGSAVRAFEVTELTPMTYHEREADQSPLLGVMSV